MQVQLYQEIKKNGPARSLRSAIWRFGQLSHTIWPVKGKAYVSNLIPCFSRIISRNEETVLETLANSFPLIMKSLGSFMNDKDVQVKKLNEINVSHINFNSFIFNTFVSDSFRSYFATSHILKCSLSKMCSQYDFISLSQ